MKSTLLFIVFLAANAFAGETGLVQQNGRFAVFQTPATLTQNRDKMGIDSILEFYESPDLRIAFDSEVAKLPDSFQKQFERTLAAWIAQRKTDWKKPIDVDDGGGVRGSDTAPFPSELKYSLYLGFAIGAKDKPAQDSHGNVVELDFNSMHSFAITVSFSSLDRLDDVERMLRSMKFTTK